MTLANTLEAEFATPGVRAGSPPRDRFAISVA